MLLKGLFSERVVVVVARGRVGVGLVVGEVLLTVFGVTAEIFNLQYHLVCENEYDNSFINYKVSNSRFEEKSLKLLTVSKPQNENT